MWVLVTPNVILQLPIYTDVDVEKERARERERESERDNNKTHTKGERLLLACYRLLLVALHQDPLSPTS